MIVIRSRQREQLGNQDDILGHVRVGRDQRFNLGALNIGSIGTFSGRRTFQAGNDGEERAISSVGCAKILQNGVGFGPKLLRECRYKVRLSQSGLG
jgi:hypothetical protein